MIVFIVNVFHWAIESDAVLYPKSLNPSLQHLPPFSLSENVQPPVSEPSVFLNYSPGINQSVKAFLIVQTPYGDDSFSILNAVSGPGFISSDYGSPKILCRIGNDPHPGYITPHCRILLRQHDEPVKLPHQSLISPGPIPVREAHQT